MPPRRLEDVAGRPVQRRKLATEQQLGADCARHGGYSSLSCQAFRASGSGWRRARLPQRRVEMPPRHWGASAGSASPFLSINLRIISALLLLDLPAEVVGGN